MAIKITDDCINCSSCESACPNKAIYPGGTGWKLADGTSVRGRFTTASGLELDAFDTQPALAQDIYYIVADKCTECTGFHDEPQCMAVCPIECCVDDENYRESKAELMEKKISLHG